ncbi:MAG: M1 family metallopeptidase [Lutibacter sp.]|nr:M1 family metallopeptidase [Lutibacter sp.]
MGFRKRAKIRSFFRLSGMLTLGYCFLLGLGPTALQAQYNNSQYKLLDIEHYRLALQVNDSTDQLAAHMEVHLQFKKPLSRFYLDLVAKDTLSGKGMVVDSVYQNEVRIDFKHLGDKLFIVPKHNFQHLTYTYKIWYRGIPADGFIIGQNLHGRRTFFGDNWPNRAKHWFPCIDHPSEKATVDYLIRVPNHYQVIANGQLKETVADSTGYLQYHYKTSVPLPSKVMTVGIAAFAVEELGETAGVPVSTWVYPETKDAGFYDFAVAPEILSFLSEHLGDYPFEKLANVQSTNRFGGMENAGTIFYAEKAVTGKRAHKTLIAHEIAHQWFGNSATETDWAHLWLSEGFATYLADLYVLSEEGIGAFRERMGEERRKVLAFYKEQQTPVVDAMTRDYMKLLNPNSYQKGAWVLHMLRDILGFDVFWEGLRQYHKKYQFANATTHDFKRVMAAVSGKNLDTFFDQWLLKAGHPVLKTRWIYHGLKLRLTIEQQQEHPFEFPLEIQLTYTDGSTEIQRIDVPGKNYSYVLETTKDVQDILLDPHTKLLFETTAP